MTEINGDIARNLLDSLGEGVIFFDPDNRVGWTNTAFERMRGGATSPLIGKSIYDCHPARDHGVVSQILDDLKTGRETIRYHRIKRAGIIDVVKEPRYDMFYTAVRNGKGEYVGTAMIIRDIWEVKNLQNQVQRSEEKYRDLVENIDAGMFSLNGKGRITYANNGLLKILGYRLNEIINRMWTELIVPEKRIEAERVFDSVFMRKSSAKFETEMIHCQKRPVYVIINISAIEFDEEDQSVARGIATDVTAQKELEREQLRKERFHGVIEMAGAACHHLNQPLANILVRTQMFLKELDEEDPHYHLLRIIEQEAIRMGTITQKIQNITSYATEPYVEGRSRIIDLEKATQKK